MKNYTENLRPEMEEAIKKLIEDYQNELERIHTELLFCLEHNIPTNIESKRVYSIVISDLGKILNKFCSKKISKNITVLEERIKELEIAKTGIPQVGIFGEQLYKQHQEKIEKLVKEREDQITYYKQLFNSGHLDNPDKGNNFVS